MKACLVICVIALTVSDVFGSYAKLKAEFQKGRKFSRHKRLLKTDAGNEYEGCSECDGICYSCEDDDDDCWEKCDTCFNDCDNYDDYDEEENNGGDNNDDSEYESDDHTEHGSDNHTEYEYENNNEYETNNSSDVLWSDVECISLSVTKISGSFLAHHDGNPKSCWRLTHTLSDMYFAMTVKVGKMQSTPFGCREETQTGYFPSDIITLRNEVGDAKPLFQTCYQGKYFDLVTDGPSLYVRMQIQADSLAEDFTINYEAKECVGHPTGCKFSTPSPTVQDTGTPYPTKYPTKAVPTSSPNELSCEITEDSLGGIMHPKRSEGSYESRERKCWSFKNPDTRAASRVAKFRVNIVDVESSDDSCADSLSIALLYKVRQGRSWISETRDVSGLPARMCGENKVFEFELETGSSSETEYIDKVNLNFRSDKMVEGKGFTAHYTWVSGGQIPSGDSNVVTDYQSLRQAIFNSGSGDTIYIDAGEIQFDESWDMIIRAGKSLVIKPQAPRDYVVFDGSLKRRKPYVGNSSLAMPADVTPQIIQVQGELKLSGIVFKLFRAQNVLVKESVGLLHVANQGRLSLESCVFENNDARPVYTNEEFNTTDPSQIGQFPKGAILQIEKGGVLESASNIVFRENIYTPIANEGTVMKLNQIVFENNDAKRALKQFDGSDYECEGTLIANGNVISMINELEFKTNDASRRIYEDPSKRPSATIHFNPIQT